MNAALAAAFAFALPWLTGCASFAAASPVGAPQAATFANVGAVRVRYVDTGPPPGAAKDAETVVLIHGFASSLETWNAVIPELARTHRVIALDLKGFGWSDRPEGDYSPFAEAEIVAGLMDARSVPSAVVVGHSWGASVALALALAAPQRVARIALYDAWVYEEQLPSFFLWSRAGGVGEALFAMYYGERADERISQAFFDKERYITEDFVEQVERALDRPGTKAAALAAARGQRYAEWQDRYRTIKQPTLLLWGRDDEVTLLSYGERLARDLPNAHMVVYPKCGHFPMIEAAAPSTHDLEKFLAEKLP